MGSVRVDSRNGEVLRSGDVSWNESRARSRGVRVHGAFDGGFEIPESHGLRGQFVAMDYSERLLETERRRPDLEIDVYSKWD